MFDIEGVEVVKRKTNMFDEESYPGLKHYYVNYRFMSLSMYYDPSDFLGSVGKPYFEIYYKGDTFRFLKTERNNLEQFVLKTTKEHDKEVNTFPERFL